MVSKTAKLRLRVELDRAGKQGVLVAKALVPVKTGDLKKTIRFEIVRSGRGALGYLGRLVAGNRDVKYARFVEENTKPHPITATNAEWLTWKGEDGAWHRAKEVRHPGTTAQPFLRPARRIIEGVLRERLHQLRKDVGRAFRGSRR